MISIALAEWLGWVEYHPVHQKVRGFIAGQGTCQVADLIPGRGACGRQPIDVSLSYRYFSLFLFLSFSLPLSRNLKKKTYPWVSIGRKEGTKEGRKGGREGGKNSINT